MVPPVEHKFKSAALLHLRNLRKRNRGLRRESAIATRTGLLVAVLACLAASFCTLYLIRMLAEKNKSCSVFVTTALTARKFPATNYVS
jgi:hypothetical protein